MALQEDTPEVHTTEKSSREGRIVSGAAVSIGAQMAIYLLSVFSVRAILANLSKEENGELFQIQRLCDFILILLVEAGMGAVALRKIIQEPENREAIIATFARMRVMLWAGAATLICGIGLIVMPDSIMPLWVWALYMLITARAPLLRYVFEMRYRAATKLILIQSLGIMDTVLFLLLVYCLPFELSALSIAVYFLVAALPGFFILAFKKGNRDVIAIPFSPKIATEILKASLPVFVSLLLVQIHDKSDAFFLGVFSNQTQVGIFAAAYRSLAPLTAIAATLTSVLTPSIAELQVTDPEKCRRYVFGGLRVLLYTACFLCIGLSAGTSLIIDLLTGGSYADNYTEFFVMLWTELPIFVTVYTIEVNIALGLQRNNYVVASMLAGCSIVTNLILTPPMAALGAIFAKIFTVGSAAVLSLYLLKPFLKGQLTVLFVVRLFLVIGLSICLSWFLPMFIPVYGAVALCIILLAAILWATRSLTMEDYAIAEKFLKRALAR